LNITDIVFNSLTQPPLVVKTIDFITKEIVVFNIERMGDGNIVDCRFAQPEFLLFINGQESFGFEEILKDKEFIFNEEVIKIGEEDDPEVIKTLQDITSSLPPDLLVNLLN